MVSFGEFGLKAMEPGWITSRQIEAARIAISRAMSRSGKMWIRIFPDKPRTRKPAETRMGKGKGALEDWVAVVKPGRVMFELSGVERSVRDVNRRASTGPGVCLFELSGDLEKSGLVAESACQLHIDGQSRVGHGGRNGDARLARVIEGWSEREQFEYQVDAPLEIEMVLGAAMGIE